MAPPPGYRSQEDDRPALPVEDTEPWLRLVFDHAPTGIAVTDTDGHIVRCNAAYAHRWDRIRINCLNIGWTESEGEAQTQREFHDAGQDWAVEAAKKVPMGKLGQPLEIAEAVVLLLSPRSDNAWYLGDEVATAIAMRTSSRKRSAVGASSRRPPTSASGSRISATASSSGSARRSRSCIA